MITLQPHTAPQASVDPTDLLLAIQLFSDPAATRAEIQRWQQAKADAEAAVAALNVQIAEAKAAHDARAVALARDEDALAQLKVHYNVLVKANEEGQSNLDARNAELDQKHAALDAERAEIARVRREVNDKLARLLAIETAGA